MSNQVQIPTITTKDDALNQVQQNANKVLRNINNQIVVLQNSLEKMTILGEIKISPISLSQFQSVAGTNWVSANGQSSVGTEYAAKYGFNTVPTISIPGTNAFIKVNNE